MLPIAPPTDCSASVRLTFSPLLRAIDCWMPPNVRLETVLEPEKNEPSAPRKEENSSQLSPVNAANALPMRITGALSPPSIIRLTITSAPNRAIKGLATRPPVSANICFTCLQFSRNRGIHSTTTSKKGISAGTYSVL
ncbi:hypothetical protein D3C78_1460550 [compost metagenome]